MKVKFITPVLYAQGKICKHENSYFAHNSKTGANYMVRVCNPRTSAFTANELAKQLLFKTAVQNALADMRKSGEEREAIIASFKAQNQYKTLFGYLVAVNYKKLS